jgi:hypothetical protein
MRMSKVLVQLAVILLQVLMELVVTVLTVLFVVCRVMKILEHVALGRNA